MKKIFLVIPMLGLALLTACQTPTQEEKTTTVNRDYTMENESVNSESIDTEETGTKEDASSNTEQNVKDDTFAYTIHDGVMDLDSDKGPYYIINLDTMKIVDCTSSGAKVVSYKKNGDILTITLFSDEYPVNSTYVIDTSKSTSDKVTKQSVENNVLKFSTQKGPDYEIDLNTLKLISCSDKTGRIVSSSKVGNELTLILYSDKLPVDMTYTFIIE